MKTSAAWKTIDRFEGLAGRASTLASGPFGTHLAFGLLAFWLGAAFVVGWSKAYDVVEEIVTISSFFLLFLLQRSQAKDTLAMQVKLNELLAAMKHASPQLINLEDRSEAEVREIHDLFQALRNAESSPHSIEEYRVLRERLKGDADSERRRSHEIAAEGVEDDDPREERADHPDGDPAPARRFDGELNGAGRT